MTIVMVKWHAFGLSLSPMPHASPRPQPLPKKAKVAPIYPAEHQAMLLQPGPPNRRNIKPQLLKNHTDFLSTCVSLKECPYLEVQNWCLYTVYSTGGRQKQKVSKRHVSCAVQPRKGLLVTPGNFRPGTEGAICISPTLLRQEL